MNPRHHSILMPLAFGAFLAFMSAWAVAQQPMEGVGITEQLGKQLPLDIVLRDEAGQDVRLGDLFADGKPALLNLVYYGCPGICQAELNGLVIALNQSKEQPGQNFRVITVSFEPEELPELAAAKKANYLNQLDQKIDPTGWRFLTGNRASIDALTAAVGFRYKKVLETDQYAHDVALMVATPDGRLSRYLRGVFYEPATLRLSLVEASDGKIGTVWEGVWVKLCGYDPQGGVYVMAAPKIMAAGGLLTLVIVMMGVSALWWREMRRQSRQAKLGNREVTTDDAQAHLA